ncbi:asparaginase [Mesonia sediminis]|uniref:Asparaginase n=1 Tax=Mesonia sediminis TaxID=1703946 RepID=A0ABW5SFB2_9FLAO
MYQNSAKILLIYTGGTIGMIKDFETGALKAFNFDDLLANIPELKLLEHKIETYSFENPIDSSDMNVGYYRKLAEVIEEAYTNYDGFVVLHGSDTMSYTASALSFMLENLNKPIIFTGSQLPIGDLRTDAKENLITSIQLAGLRKANKSVITEVGLYFEYKLYRANRTTKINAEHFQAFASLNYPALAESGVNLTINKPKLKQANYKKDLIVHKELDENVLVIKIFPGLHPKTLAYLLAAPHIKAVILETYGAGNAFSEDWFIKLLSDHIARGLKIINVTQCIGGAVNMGLYATSTRLEKIGVISGKDITTEAAVAKTMYLLGKNLSPTVFKTIFETAIRGEMM